MKDQNSQSKVAVPNPKEMLDLGRSFLFAGKKLFSPDVSSGKMVMCVVPAIVSIALSLELLLKCYHQIRANSFKKIHDLKTLYEQLPIDDQQLIASKLNMANAAEVAAKLAPIAHAFENWRYAFESKNLHVESEFPIQLCQVMVLLFENELKEEFPKFNGKTLIVDRCDDCGSS